MIKRVFCCAIFLVGFLFFTGAGTAQAVSLPDFSGASDLPGFISSVYSFALTIVGVAIFIRILQAGFLMLTAAGNASKWSDARTKMQNAVIGAIILFSAYLILYVINPDLVTNTFNFNLPSSSQAPSGSLVGQSTSQTSGPAQVKGKIPADSAFMEKFLPSARAAGIYSFDLKVVDADGNACVQTYNIETVAQLGLKPERTTTAAVKSGFLGASAAKAADDCSVVSLAVVSIPQAVEGAEYYAEIPAYGGRMPYVYSIIDGELPPGLSLVVDEPRAAYIGSTPSDSSSAENKNGIVTTLLSAPQTARYVKFLRPISVMQPGLGPVWTGLREIEIYDSAGTKIPIVNSSANNWLPANADQSYAQTSGKAHDGDFKTFWYEPGGEYYEIWNGDKQVNTCHWATLGTYPNGLACDNKAGINTGTGYYKYFNSWIQFDLGSQKTISKIKLWGYYIQNQYPLIDQILVSSDGTTFTKIFEFQYSDLVNHFGQPGLGSNGRDNIGCLNWPSGIQQASGSCDSGATGGSPSPSPSPTRTVTASPTPRPPVTTGFCATRSSTCSPPAGGFTFIEGVYGCQGNTNEGLLCTSDDYCADLGLGGKCWARSNGTCGCTSESSAKLIGPCCFDYTSSSFATTETANTLSKCLGMEIETTPVNSWIYVHPADTRIYSLRAPNGERINAGAAADLYNRHSRQEVDAIIAEEACR
jgi:hypothetical protein